MKQFTGILVVIAVALAISCENVTVGMQTATATSSSSSSSSILSNGKHPLENRDSWDFHLERQLEAGRDRGRDCAQTNNTDTNTNGNGNDNTNSDGNINTNNLRRILQTAAAVVSHPRENKKEDDEASNNGNNNNDDDDNDNDNDRPFTIIHKKNQKHIPFADGDTTHGMMIDAGSQGTRLHIYEWDKRFLFDEADLVEQSNGMKLSYPTSNSRWTDKYEPGLDVFSDSHTNPEDLERAVGEYLGRLLDFAKKILKDKKEEWHNYPIYLKATGGLRTLSQPERVRLMGCVRRLFHNKTYNPFAFEDERARVISGEEEAIYGWVGVNFAKGVLIDNSKGFGTGKDPKLTYGMLALGGASTQIANFENNGDLMANLFKLQLGGARHWNVYVHSYLYFGINGAWSRLNSRLYWQDKSVNPCLPIGSNIEFDSWMHMNEDDQFYPRSDPRSTPYSVTMTNNQTKFDFEDCSRHTNSLLRKRTNKDWCDFQMDGNCGFAGIYQPPMPQENTQIDEFIGSSNFVHVYEFLQLGDRASVSKIGKAAEAVCGLDWHELKKYNSKLKYPIQTDLVLAQYCFRSVFAYHLLRNGWEFGDDYELTAVHYIAGQKIGWALGCMLYEINTLPWNFHPELLYRGPSWYVIGVYTVVGTLIGSAIGFMVAMRISESFNKTIRESHYFKNHPGISSNPMVQKTLSLPDMGMSLDELEQLYGGDNGTPTIKEAAANEKMPLSKLNAKWSKLSNYNTT